MQHDKARAVFLDRDGTIIVDQDYLKDPDAVELIHGAADAIVKLRDAGFVVVVVTNQSGVARGIMTNEDYRAVQARVEQVLAEQGARLDAVYFCPHHPDYTGPCDCRKPGLGMYQEAARNLNLSLADSFYVGDKLSDVLPALSTGGHGILVRTGYGIVDAELAPRGVEVVENLAEAARWILEKSRATP